MAVQTAFDFARRDATQEASSVGSVTAPRARPVSDRALARSGRAQHGAEASLLAARLESALRTRSRIPLRLTVTDNRRTMISQRRGPGCVEVRLHHMFLYADESLWCALADYLIDADRSAAQHIGNFIERHRERIRRNGPARRTPISTAGIHFDLVEIYRAVKQRYFAEASDARITWGRDPSGARRSRRSIKLGSYTSRDALIRVHPALDAAFVPRFFVEYIVYHELLHHVLPPTRKSGRRNLHGADFQARERQFAEYEAALCWERENLARLLRRTPRKPAQSR